MRGLLIALLVGCGGVQAPLQSSPVVSVDEPSPMPTDGPALVEDDGLVLGSYPDGPATLIGLGTRCVGEVENGRLRGCVLERVRVVLPGDAVATLFAPESDVAPELAVDAPLRGGFPGHPLRFAIESPPGDALCPGSPTLIRFFQGEAPLGTVSLDAPVTRQLGQGVVALLATADEAFVLLGWGRDRWRLVSVGGETLSEGHFAPEQCDCCE
ncbi:MAG: hypothetical protein ACI9KE_000298 [Polyangiales bacterium]|jgi:hypothetical protein